jgi:hypothetical protein
METFGNPDNRPRDNTGMRLYFMGRQRKPLLDPRDIPRGYTGHPLPSFEVKLEKTPCKMPAASGRLTWTRISQILLSLCPKLSNRLGPLRYRKRCCGKYH